MTAMLMRQFRAAEYRDRAVDASALAEASTLQHVREKYEVAAARWRQLSALNERTDPSSSARPPAFVKQPHPEASAQIREDATCIA